VIGKRTKPEEILVPSIPSSDQISNNEDHINLPEGGEEDQISNFSESDIDIESAKNSAFTMIPPFRKAAGKSKFAKLGMATASILALSTCMHAFLGN